MLHVTVAVGHPAPDHTYNAGYGASGSKAATLLPLVDGPANQPLTRDDVVETTTEWAMGDSNPRPLPCEDTFALGEDFIGWVIKVTHRTLFTLVSRTF